MLKIIIITLLGLYGIVNTADEREIEGKVIVVTGAAQGIGYAIADNFLANNAAFVIILDKNSGKGFVAEQNLREKYGDKVEFIICDVTKDLSIWDEIVQKYQQIDIFVNNAVVIDINNPRNTITTNTIAYVEWSMKFLEHARMDKGGCGGTIINVASVTAHWVAPFFPAYIASKYGDLGFSKSLGHEFNYKCTGVRVVVVCPSFTFTALSTNQQVVSDELVDLFDLYKSTQRWQTPDQVGKRVMEVFRNAKSGTSWDIVGGDPAVESVATEYIVFTHDLLIDATCEASGCDYSY